MRFTLVSLVALSIFFSISGPVMGAATTPAPVLAFTDLAVAGNTGFTDGTVTNQGAIVTVWGQNLGSSQGTSTITVGGVAPAHIYYWKNADGTLPGGPADLYTKQGMQEIAFSLSSSTPAGTEPIVVTVGGVASNSTVTLSVVGSGMSTAFVNSSTGINQSGCGSWSSPCQTWNYVFGFASAGITIYSQNTNTVAAGSGGYDMYIQNLDCSATAPCSIVTYPNTTLTLTQSDTTTVTGINSYTGNYWFGRDLYWTVSKITGVTNGAFAVLGTGARFVGNNITNYSVQGTGAGIVGGWSSGWVILGNYFHNLVAGSGDNQEHIIYIAHKNWDAHPGTPLSPLNIGWNRFNNNTTRFAIHFNGEHSCGYINDGTLIHDNWIEDQDAYGIGFNGSCYQSGAGGDGVYPSLAGPWPWNVGHVKVYNNICIRCGLNRQGTSGNYTSAWYFLGGGGGNGGTTSGTVEGTIDFFNNTAYSTAYSPGVYTNCLSDSSSGFCSAVMNNGAYLTSMLSNGTTSGGTGNLEINWWNNIVYDVAGYGYFNTSCSNCSASDPIVTPTGHSNNLYFSSYSTQPTIPSWDTSPINSNPNFVSPSSDEFNLASGSPALGAGTASISPDSVPIYDTVGDTRPNPPSIGAFDDPPNGSNPVVPPPPAAPWILLQ